ncbi:hypothetical protein JD844_024515 [Phrynosoma platyrhinos]|uniref:HBS1-like protein N-terminal domain-containing protein n=1 Tax=Phrynosoma platyrhinos TaxID=52577 RepID=A0ABQ7SYE2_PHRPL|nr:hypothetical protein JD844_024515 [Phrynosoma platyrhinos]
MVNCKKFNYVFPCLDFEDDDLYGQSVEDDYCISPSTAAQFIYSRRDNPRGYAETLEEEEYGNEGTEHSNCISNHPLTGVEKAQLESCLDHMREVLGESVAEKVMVDAVLQSKFDVQQALDSVLSQDKQNMKTKNEDTVLTGKAAKGLLCSDIFSDVNKLTNMVEHSSDCGSSSFSPGDPIVSSESFCNPQDPSDKMLFRHKCVKTPLIKKKMLMSSCKSLGQLSHPLNDNNISYDESFKKQASLPLADSRADWKSCNECSLCFSSGVEKLKENPSEKGSCNHLKCERVHDLKTLLRLNETGDSPDDQDIDLIVFQKKSDYDSKIYLENPPGLISGLGNMMLDNKINNKFTEETLTEETECLSINPSFPLNKSSFQEHKISSAYPDSLKFSLSESPSLADLLQEHQDSNPNKTFPLSDFCNPNKTFPLSDLCNPSSTSFTDMELGYSPLSQLASQPQASSGMTELSGSLSSLTFSRSSPVKELESLSLADLIAKSIEVVKPETSNSSELHRSKIMQPIVVNSDIDLSVLIRKSALTSEPTEVKAGMPLPETEALCSTHGEQIHSVKGGKKSKKRMRSHILEGTVPRTKALSARPSAFAITLCLHYPSKRCKRQTVTLHKAFLYSRQMQEVKINDVGPLLAITPFDFKSPSPDDIVKSGQKKAFTR